LRTSQGTAAEEQQFSVHHQKRIPNFYIHVFNGKITEKMHTVIDRVDVFHIR
jgi:hypothetical protein